MIVNRWQDSAAKAARQNAAGSGIEPDLAERIYSARLIGADPALVLHGGGNSSLKLFQRDLFGDLVEVMHVKGSGHDLGRIDAAGMPAVRLEPLLRLQVLAGLSDAGMVNALRAALLDQSAPNPSVEALLHAYLPHRFVDHTHATPFLVLANLPEAAAAAREIFGARVALVPYVRPGFGLAMAAAAAYAENPGCEGLLLCNHGHFTWGEDAATSYARMISQANEVAEWLAARRDGPSYPALALAGAEAAPASAAPAPEPAATLMALRGAIGAHLPEDAAMPVFDLRAGPAERAFMARPDLADLARRGVATPDHVIRTKGFPLLLDAATLAGGPEAIRAAVADFIADYGRYFATHAPRHEGQPQMLSPLPGLAWIVGLGLVGIGADARAAAIAADIGVQTLEVMQDGEAVGGFRPIGAADLFDMEYWALEQAKLGRAAPPGLQGRIVLVTGGAGAIGLATAEAFAARGATIFVLDRDAGALAAALDRLGPGHDGLACDITAAGAGAAAVAACAARFGGLDIVVSNAGAAISGDVATLPEATLRASFELNFFSHMALSQAAVAAFRAQGRGGQILFNVSKQAVNPGKGFAAYGLPKATTFFLLRQLALELGGEGIRVNGINADRIRSGLLTPEMIASRAAARNLDVASYMGGNLLRREVEARHVAEGFVMLALAERTTAHVLTVDGGNIEAALR